MASLTIYRASAGAGKTFTLAVEYMTLLINNPYDFKRILAVTFTNKATEEMKLRILSQLYALAYLTGAKKNDYLLQIQDKTGLGEGVVRERAKMALHLLLHNFNYFRVETIDKFFQTVLRNLARELELNANLTVALNDIQIEEKAVDEMIEELDGKSPVLHWIMEYISDSMQDDKSWNVIDKIKDFGRNIFKDEYKANVAGINERFHEKGFFNAFKKQLKSIEEEGDRHIKEQGDAFFELLEQHGLQESDFKKNAVNYFTKLKTGRYVDEGEKNIVYNKSAREAAESADGWVRKADKTAGNAAYELAESRLVEFISESETLRIKQLRQILSARMIRQHIDQLRLLKYIEEKVRDINNDHNRFLLSNTQTLLHDLIGQSDSPFIFEKIGVMLEHIMIDEFQDTSNIQWNNFKVLLKECMSHENAFNLIVGDVKQSIYRWRDGNWRLLNKLEQQFNPQQIESETLATNYRSDANIIHFNNKFFTFARQEEYDALVKDTPAEAEELLKAYSDVAQQIPMGKDEARGLVEIKLLESKSNSYVTETLEHVGRKVQELLDAGARESDIAILVRNNSTIQDIGDYFMEHMPHVRLVSDEAFHLDAALAVNMLVMAMRVIADPTDQIAKAALLLNHRKNIKKTEERVTDILIKGKSVDEQLPAAFIQHLEELSVMPVMDMVEKLYHIFDLKDLDKQSAYVCAFFDELGNYLNENVADVVSFLKYWDEDLHKKSIQSSEQKGIRLITIHKSKGLEFDHVIMPFCDWLLEKRNTIWCKPTEAPYDQLSLIPVDFDKSKMLNSIFAQDYKIEHLQNMVDNLNLLYVGFTRAKRNLFVYGQKGCSDKNRSKLLEDFIKGDSYSFGELDIPMEKEQDETKTDNIFEVKPQDVAIQIENYKTIVDFRQSNKSKDFVNGEEDDEGTQRQYIKMGNVFHQIFASIRTTADIPTVLATLEHDGVLFDNYLTYDKVKTMLQKRFDNPTVKDWFSDRWDLHNECSILRYDSIAGKLLERRPDRVMTDGQEMIVVDFKFGTPKEEHRRQVSEYMQLLREMGHANVKGYLWYVYTNKIDEVK